MWVSIYEERIRACVPSGCMNTFRERSLKLSSCAIQYAPGLLRYGDVPELFSLMAPRPMQLMTGEKDGLINDADRDRMIRFIGRASRPCLAFKVLAAGRKCPSDEGLAAALRLAYDSIKPTDVVAVGMWQKYNDQVGQNTRLVRDVLTGKS